MDTWTRQAGFPVVSAIRNGTKITLSQQRFLADPDAEYSPESSPFKYKWEILITYTTSANNLVHQLWLTKDKDSSTYSFSNIEINTNLIFLFKSYN